jgi:hydroxybutyrate-dimer hydrolase
VHSRQLFDVATFFNLYQPCASALASGENSAAGRCAALQVRGLLSSVGLNNQVAEAQRLLIDYGAQSSNTALAPFYYLTQHYASLAYTNANAYGRFSVVDNLCGYSLGAAQGINPPVALNVQSRAAAFVDNSGAPPALSERIALIKNAGNNGAGINFRNSEDENGVADEFLAGALCLRNLFTGSTGISQGLGVPLIGDRLVQANRVQNGQAAVTATANLRNKPAVIVQGRDDPLAAVNFYGRAYYGRGQATGVGAAQLRYIEVNNAHHFDGYNARFGLTSYIPLHYYFSAALDSVLDHVRNQRALPSSQVVATLQPTGLGGINRNNLPALGASDNCSITFVTASNNRQELVVPACD